MLPPLICSPLFIATGDNPLKADIVHAGLKDHSLMRREHRQAEPERSLALALLGGNAERFNALTAQARAMIA